MKIRRALITTMIALFAIVNSAKGATNTYLTLDSQPGDYIGQGVNRSFAAGDGTFSVGQTYNGGVQVSFSNATDWWYLDFGPATGQTLSADLYEGAQRFSFQSPTRPGVDVFGDGRGCNTITGRFLVSELTLSASGTIQSLAIDFEQHCEGATPALFGSVRFNSAVAAIPRVSVATATALKGNAGSSDATVILSLCLPSSQTVNVRYNTVSGTAVGGKDYRQSVGTVTFPPGVTSESITIPITGDRLASGNKSFKVVLSYPHGAPIGDGDATVTILDPNVPLSVLSMYGQTGDYISPGQLLITTADATFTSSSSQAVAVSVQNGDFWTLDFAGPTSPLLPGDYEGAQRYPFQPAGAPGLSVYGAGRGCNTLTGRFVVLDASYLTAGGVQSFGADFEQHCEGATAGLFGSIRVNSNLRQLSVTNAVVNKTSLQAVFTVTLNPASANPVWVNFATVDGTAIAGGDYHTTSQTIQFAPGETVHTVTVGLIAQPLNAPSKKFFGQISAPSGAPIWISKGSATLE